MNKIQEQIEQAEKQVQELKKTIEELKQQAESKPETPYIRPKFEPVNEIFSFNGLSNQSRFNFMTYEKCKAVIDEIGQEALSHVYRCGFTL